MSALHTIQWAEVHLKGEAHRRDRDKWSLVTRMSRNRGSSEYSCWFNFIFHFCYFNTNNVNLISCSSECRLVLTKAAHTPRPHQNLNILILRNLRVSHKKSKTWCCCLDRFLCRVLCCIFCLCYGFSLGLAHGQQKEGNNCNEENIRLHVAPCLYTESSPCAEQLNQKSKSFSHLLTSMCTDRRKSSFELNVRQKSIKMKEYQVSMEIYGS